MKNLFTILLTLAMTSVATGQVYFKTHIIQDEYPTTGIGVADIDGEGNLDLVRLNRSRDLVDVMLNNGIDQPFEVIPRNTNFFSPRDLIIGDFDNDGGDDYSVISEDELGVRLFLSGGGDIDIVDGDLGLEGYDAKDVDGDGDFDIAVVSFWGEDITLYTAEEFGNYNSNANSPPTKIKHLSIGGFIGDSLLDFVCTGETNGIYLLENDDFLFPMTTIDEDYQSPSAIKAVDIDSDGDDDILVLSESRNEMVWYEQDAGSFTKRMITTDGIGPKSVKYADLEGDGDLDLFTVSSSTGGFIWWENDGSQNFTAKVIAGGFQNPTDISIGDMDGDGDLDIVGSTAAAFDDERVFIFEHLQEPSNVHEPYDGKRELSPNPTSGMITFRLDDTSEKIEQVTLKSITGTTLLEAEPNDHQLEMNLTGYAPGVYLLLANTKSGSITERVIVTR